MTGKSRLLEILGKLRPTKGDSLRAFKIALGGHNRRLDRTPGVLGDLPPALLNLQQFYLDGFCKFSLT
jgi:hypothetical protein